jgi:hypothetical protein
MLSESGARMALRIELSDRCSFSAHDRFPMAPMFACLNSVDRTAPFVAQREVTHTIGVTRCGGMAIQGPAPSLCPMGGSSWS